jgi:hypothetical protein
MTTTNDLSPEPAAAATSADAPPYDRLVAWLGRDPHWSPA